MGGVEKESDRARARELRHMLVCASQTPVVGCYVRTPSKLRENREV